MSPETLVRVFRSHNLVYVAVPFVVQLDGKRIGSVRDDEMLDPSVPPGPHELMVIKASRIHRVLEESSPAITFEAMGRPVCLECGLSVTMADLLAYNAAIEALGAILVKIAVLAGIMAGTKATRVRFLTLRIVDCGEPPGPPDTTVPRRTQIPGRPTCA